jgi:hypothetical protein
MLGESCAKELQKIPLPDNTVGRRISDIWEDLCDELIDRLKISRFAFRADKATVVVKGAHLPAYLQYVLENIKKDFMFYKPIDGRDTSL